MKLKVIVIADGLYIGEGVKRKAEIKHRFLPRFSAEIIGCMMAPLCEIEKSGGLIFTVLLNM